MCRLRRLAAFTAALALVLAGCGTAAKGREAHPARRLANALDQWFLRRQPVVDVGADR